MGVSLIRWTIKQLSQKPFSISKKVVFTCFDTFITASSIKAHNRMVTLENERTKQKKQTELPK